MRRTGVAARDGQRADTNGLLEKRSRRAGTAPGSARARRRRGYLRRSSPVARARAGHGCVPSGSVEAFEVIGGRESALAGTAASKGVRPVRILLEKIPHRPAPARLGAW